MFSLFIDSRIEKRSIEPRRRFDNTPHRRMGTLYYGDNLDILRRYITDESIELVLRRSSVQFGAERRPVRPGKRTKILG